MCALFEFSSFSYVNSIIKSYFLKEHFLVLTNNNHSDHGNAINFLFWERPGLSVGDFPVPSCSTVVFSSGSFQLSPPKRTYSSSDLKYLSYSCPLPRIPTGILQISKTNIFLMCQGANPPLHNPTTPGMQNKHPPHHQKPGSFPLQNRLQGSFSSKTSPPLMPGILLSTGLQGSHLSLNLSSKSLVGSLDRKDLFCVNLIILPSPPSRPRICLDPASPSGR